MELKLFNVDNIRARTVELRSGKDKPTSIFVDERHEQVQKAFDEGSWGCQKESVRNLIQAITGYEIVAAPEKADSPFVMGALVRFKRKTVLIRHIDSDGDAHFYTAGGDEEVGGDSWVQKTARWVPADEAAVEAFLREAGLISEPATAEPA